MAKGFQDYPRTVQGGILAGLALTLAGAAAWYWLLPFHQACAKEAAQVKALHAQNVTSRVFEKQRSMYQSRIAEQSAKLEALRTKVPDAPGADVVVNLIHEAETASGVHVRSLVASPPVTADEYLELPFSLRADGTYFGLISFFTHLGEADRITNVTGLALNVPKPGGRGAYKVGAAETVAADFTLSAYCNRPAGAAPAQKKKKR